MIVNLEWKGRSLAVGPLPPPVAERLPSLVGLRPSGRRPDRRLPIGEAGGRYLLPGGETAADEAELLVRLASQLHASLLDLPGLHVLHAAAAILGGEAALFIGPMRIGKSTLALELLLAGHALLGDDVALLDGPAATVEAVPKPLKLRLAGPRLPPRLAHLPAAGLALAPYQGDLALLLGRCLPGFAPLGRAYPLGDVYLLRRSPAAGCSILPADRVGLLGAVLEQTFIGEPRGLAVLPPFVERLAAGRAFILTVGQHAAAAAVAAISVARAGPL